MRNSVRLRIIILIALAAFLFTLVAVGLGGYLGISYLEDNYAKNIRSHMRLASISLESPIARMDYLELEEQAKVILEFGGIIGVQILDQNKNLILEKGSFEGRISEKAILQNNEKTGTLRVSFSSLPLQKGVFFVLSLCALFLLLGLPVFIVIVWYLSSKYLKDLTELTKCISDGSCEKLPSYPGENRQDEVGMLAQTLRLRDNELFAYNRELEEYKETLEQKVEIFTCGYFSRCSMK